MGDERGERRLGSVRELGVEVRELWHESRELGVGMRELWLVLRDLVGECTIRCLCCAIW